MKNISIVFFFFLFSGTVHSQDVSGKWTGYFTDPVSVDERHSFEIEFIKKDTCWQAITKTYIKINSKEYYTTFLALVVIDSLSGAFIVTEIEQLKSNFPILIQNCPQRHTLLYSVSSNFEVLTGKWTITNESMNCGQGSTTLKKKIPKKRQLKQN
ncbi:MAG: hypothetical protein ABL872_17615 [Lacibacter sp.]